MSLYDRVAGVADNAAGSIDESIGRQFDDTEGGGLIDGFQSFNRAGTSQSTRDLAEATKGDVGPNNQFDNTAIDNQFDDTPGGGVADTATDTVLNIGPDWLDEAATIGVVVLIVGVLLYLARPLLEIGAATVE